MKRRAALRQLAILAAGAAVLPGCFREDNILVLDPPRIQLGKRSAEFIQHLSQVILPLDDIKIDTPEPFPKFVSTMINDCHSPEEIQQFGTGYKAYKLYLDETLDVDIDGLSSAEEAVIFQQVEQESAMPPDARFFFSKVRQLAIRHVATSSVYLSQYDNFEMIPGRFNGCAEV